MVARDVRTHVCTRCPVLFVQGDHLTNPAFATLLTIFLRHVLTNPSDTQDSLSRCCGLGARRSSFPPSLLHEHSSFLVKTMMLPSFLERVGLLLVALLTRSVPRSCFRPGTRGPAPCGLFCTTFFGTLPSRMDGAVVLERVGLLLSAFHGVP